MRKHFILLGFAALYVLVLSSCCHKKEEQEVINTIINKVWFTTSDERWNTDYSNNYIPESYRKYTYTTKPGSENWLWYFMDDFTGYEINTENFDTVYYHFEYKYTYKDNSLYVKFETIDGSTEEYHASVEQIDDKSFIWSHEYRSHQFERITTENVTGSSKRGEVFRINPRNVKRKPVGPMIQVTK